MSRADVLKVADGRVFTGRKALELGLVDELGDLKHAVRVAGELAGIAGEPTVRELSGSGWLFGNLLGRLFTPPSSWAAPGGLYALEPEPAILH